MRRSPSDQASLIHAAPRLACVKPVASVHPEPGSNSSLYNISFFRPCNHHLVNQRERLAVLSRYIRYRGSELRSSNRIDRFAFAFLYYKFPCLCKSVKDQFHRRRFPYSPQWRSSFLVCECKGTAKFRTDQMFRQLFLKKVQFFMLHGIKRGTKNELHLILYYAREGLLFF